MADIKARLKRVKELLETQEWQKAFDICERILSEDAQNTPAGLFMGKTAMELNKPDRAIECFRTVAKNQPDQAVAWQGIIAFYGKYKQPLEFSEELLEAYQRCLDQLGDDEKFKPKIVEYLLGYCRQMDLKGSTEGIQPILERLIRHATGMTFLDARVEGRQRLLRFFLPKKYETDLTSLTAEQLDLVLATFELLLSEFHQTNLDGNYPQEHLNTLLRLHRPTEAIRYAEKYLDRCPTQFGFRPDFILAIFVMSAIKELLQAGSDLFATDDPTWSRLEKLAILEPQHPLVRIRKAFLAFLARNFSKSADLFEKALSEGKGVPSLPLMYRVPFMDTIERFSRKYLGISLISLGEREGVEKGCGLLRGIVGTEAESWEVFFYVGFSLVEKGDVEGVKRVLVEGYKVLEGDEEGKGCLGGLEAFVALERKDFETAEKLSEIATSLADTNHLLHYIAFRSLWDNGRRDPRGPVIKHLRRTIELYPDFALPHLYWAFYLWRENSDLDAAFVEYELAYKLLPQDPRVIRGVTDFCTLDHRDERAIEILREAVHSSSLGPTDCRWMRLRLALLCHRNKLWHDCISNLRHILRLYPDDRLVKEFLADALNFRGNFWSAAAMFEDVLGKGDSDRSELSDYSLYRLASLRQKLKLDQLAEEDFRRLIKSSSSAYRGMSMVNLAEIELRKAKVAFHGCCPVIGVECCQKAVDLLSQSLHLGQTSPVTWSLLGDTCLLMRYVRPGETVLVIEKSLWTGEKESGKMALNIRQVLYLATVFYGVAIDLRRTSCRLWERLAVGYFFLAKRVEGAGDLEGARNWSKRSLLAVREMLHRNPYNPWVWRTAGFIVKGCNISAEVDACRLLTKSIELFRHFDLNPTVSAATWTDLGFVFVSKRRYLAGNALLKKGQDADPKLPEPWMGQAWCAERLGSPVEAMDLTRHACSLGLAKSALRRYGEWVVWLCWNRDGLVDSHLRWAILQRLDAVPTAINHLLQYLQMCEDDASVAMVLSLLLEWSGLPKSALPLARKAVGMIENSETRFQPPGAELWDMAKMNLARLLCENGDFAEALTIMVTTEADPSLGMVLLLATVHFGLKDWDQSLAMLEVAVSVSEDEKTVAAIRLATAVVHLYNRAYGEVSALCVHLLKHAAVSTRLDLLAKLVFSLSQICQNGPERSLTDIWNEYLLDSTTTQFPIDNELNRVEQLGRTLSRSSSDSNDGGQLVHLQPSRIDFRLAALLDSHTRRPSPSPSGDKSTESELLDDLLALTDVAGLYKEFWQILLEVSGNCLEKRDLVEKARQTGRHLYPYERDWLKSVN